MRRTLVHLTLLTALALIAAPAAPGMNPGTDRPAEGAVCPLGTCGEKGGSIDPNGLAAVDSCPLGTCGERGPVIDPNGAPLRLDFLRT